MNAKVKWYQAIVPLKWHPHRPQRPSEALRVAPSSILLPFDSKSSKLFSEELTELTVDTVREVKAATVWSGMRVMGRVRRQSQAELPWNSKEAPQDLQLPQVEC